MGRVPASKTSNGWRNGQDPVQRWLRILTAVVCLAVFVFLAITVATGVAAGPDRVVVIALALGAVLVLLGYEGILRLPIIGAELPGKSQQQPVEEEEESA